MTINGDSVGRGGVVKGVKGPGGIVNVPVGNGDITVVRLEPSVIFLFLSFYYPFI
jgi:hypothetical protein